MSEHMPNLEEKAIEVIDKAMDGVEKLSNMLSDVAVQYGPEVVDAALTVVRISGAGNIVVGLTLAILPLFFFCNIKNLWKWALKHETSSDSGSLVLVVLSGMGCVASSIVSFIMLINLWTWVAIIEPKLWVAHEILKW